MVVSYAKKRDGDIQRDSRVTHIAGGCLGGSNRQHAEYTTFVTIGKVTKNLHNEEYAKRMPEDLAKEENESDKRLRFIASLRKGGTIRGFTRRRGFRRLGGAVGHAFIKCSCPIV